MLNYTIMMGRMTRDPELRRTATGTAVTNFAIACERDIANKETGDRETDFFECVAWRGTGEFVDKYFKKGSMVVVAGRFQNRDWTDKEGNKRKATELVVDHVYFGDSKKDTASAPAAVPASDFKQIDIPDEQLPF